MFSVSHCQHKMCQIINEVWSVNYCFATIDNAVFSRCRKSRERRKCARNFAVTSGLCIPACQEEPHMHFQHFLRSLESGIYALGIKLNGGGLGATKACNCFIITSDMTYPVINQHYWVESRDLYAIRKSCRLLKTCLLKFKLQFYLSHTQAYTVAQAVK